VVEEVPVVADKLGGALVEAEIVVFSTERWFVLPSFVIDRQPNQRIDATMALGVRDSLAYLDMPRWSKQSIISGLSDHPLLRPSTKNIFSLSVGNKNFIRDVFRDNSGNHLKK
jgi:hypothetical protein